MLTTPQCGTTLPMTTEAVAKSKTAALLRPATALATRSEE
jgi:hypothetical protein